MRAWRLCIREQQQEEEASRRDSERFEDLWSAVSSARDAVLVCSAHERREVFEDDELALAAHATHQRRREARRDGCGCCETAGPPAECAIGQSARRLLPRNV